MLRFLEADEFRSQDLGINVSHKCEAASLFCGFSIARNLVIAHHYVSVNSCHPMPRCGDYNDSHV